MRSLCSTCRAQGEVAPTLELQENDLRGTSRAQLCHVFKSIPLQRVPAAGHRDRGALAVALPAGGAGTLRRGTASRGVEEGENAWKGWEEKGRNRAKRGKWAQSRAAARAQCWWCQLGQGHYPNTQRWG